MIYKRRFIIVFLLFSLLLLQAYAWPWNPPEVKARKLVDKLEKFASELDGVEGRTGLTNRRR